MARQARTSRAFLEWQFGDTARLDLVLTRLPIPILQSLDLMVRILSCYASPQVRKCGLAIDRVDGDLWPEWLYSILAARPDKAVRCSALGILLLEETGETSETK